MDCCLWLNRKKISSAAEIIENFDLAAVRGYFLGGSLSEWLRDHDGAVYADRLDGLKTLDPQDPQLNDRLAEAFGVSVGAVSEVFCGNAPDNGAYAGQDGGSWCGSFGSFSGSFNFGSFGGFGSYGGFQGSGVFGGSGLGIGSGGYAGSWFAGSGGLTALGSYRFSLWEWEWEWRFARRGSFRGSFSAGSLGSLGSFGSYRFGSGSYLLGSFGSFPRGSFSGSFGAGSFGGLGSGGFITADEYDRIMYECLRKCPLNCYGYGIHIV